MISLFKTYKELKKAGVLGINARNHSYVLSQNNRKYFPLVDNKLETKKVALSNGINTTKVIGVINCGYEVKNLLNIVKDYKEFVIKPAQGSGGKGIVVIKSFNNNTFTTASNHILTLKEINEHCFNILSGLYSLGGKNDVIIIEEMIQFTDIFKEYSYQGVPDARIIIYKGMPVLSMMRLSTSMSNGKANLHQGAVGVGIDLKNGKASYAVMKGKPISIHPDTKADLSKLVIPNWQEHLAIAYKACEITHLNYVGVDIVLDKTRGALLLEINARPGLAIQIANRIGLKHRLDIVDNNINLISKMSNEEKFNFMCKYF